MQRLIHKRGKVNDHTKMVYEHVLAAIIELDRALHSILRDDNTELALLARAEALRARLTALVERWDDDGVAHRDCARELRAILKGDDDA